MKIRWGEIIKPIINWHPGTVSAVVELQHKLFDKVTKPSCQAGRTVLQEMMGSTGSVESDNNEHKPLDGLDPSVKRHFLE
jgi:hypothetical protein